MLVLMARGLSTARNTPGLRSRRLKEVRVAADKRQLELLLDLEAAGRVHKVDVAPRTSLKRMVSGWENGAPMSADYRKLFCTVYGLSEAELGFTAKDEPPATPLGADLDPWELARAEAKSADQAVSCEFVVLGRRGGWDGCGRVGSMVVPTPSVEPRATSVDVIFSDGGSGCPAWRACPCRRADRGAGRCA